MRLGLVMAGVGAQAAANAGVMLALEERGVAVQSVCALHGGAWCAALYAMGKSAKEMQAAASAGGRLLRPGFFARHAGNRALCDGRRLEQTLLLQAGHRVLSLCARAAAFPCRMVRTGHRVVFSTRAFSQEDGAILAMQATVSFAARAAMALPGALAPVEFMGSALLGESDEAFCVRVLFGMGADRVLIIRPRLCPKRKPDALDLAGAALSFSGCAALPAHTGVLDVAMPEAAGAMDFERAALFVQAGYRAANESLDGIFDGMGMAHCRVLPFSRRITARSP